jgi:hypothetical protein
MRCAVEHRFGTNKRSAPQYTLLPLRAPILHYAAALASAGTLTAGLVWDTTGRGENGDIEGCGPLAVNLPALDYIRRAMQQSRGGTLTGFACPR